MVLCFFFVFRSYIFPYQVLIFLVYLFLCTFFGCISLVECRGQGFRTRMRSVYHEHLFHEWEGGIHDNVGGMPPCDTRSMAPSI